MYSQTPIFTRLLRVARHSGREHRLLRFHQRGTVQGRRQARRHRPLLPLEARHSARAQPALQGARQKKPLDIIFFPMIDCLTSDLKAMRRPLAPAPPWPPRRQPSKRRSPRKAISSRRRASSSSTPSSTSAKPDALRAADVRTVQGHPRPLAGRESRAPSQEGLPRAAITSTTSPCAARRAKCSKSWKREDRHRRGAAGPSVSQRPRREPRNPGGVPEARLPGVHRRTACPSTTTSSGGCSARKSKPGEIPHPMDITDVWKNSYSENTSQKVWAAKYVARHPNLVALELSSFKCGHDAPIYTVVEETVEQVRHAVLLASRISTRTSRPARSGSASRPSATS